MRAVKSVSIDSERRVIITFLDGSTETLYPNCIWCDAEALREIIKELLEEKADAVVQTINNMAVATFEDGADEALIRKLLVNIEPIQEGTGDPSPENVRPISGRTGLSVVRSGKNLLKNTGSTLTTNGVTFTVNDDGTISTSGVATGTAVFRIYVSITDLPKADSFIMNGCPAGGNYSNKYSMILSDIGGASLGGIDTGNGATFTASSLKTLAQLQIIIRTTTDTNGLTFKPMIRTASDTDPTFVPYKGSTYSVNWETEAGSVYGGTLDVVSGKLTVDRGYIASYNGETLPSTWISDRDVYAEGTTPTTGAQVVYTLADPVVYQLAPQEIATLLGTNNVWADSGDIMELEYVADTKLYIWGDAEAPVQDVQVNGTSILQNGVANLEAGAWPTRGFVTIYNGYGISIRKGGYYNGMLQLDVVENSAVKNSDAYAALRPSQINLIAFYGLAKAAGDTTQSASSNAVGNYTEDAKSAIQSMLGISDIIGGVEGAMASTAYSVGDVFLHKGILYKATSSIASGDAIVPGTNCEQTTIINILKGE